MSFNLSLMSRVKGVPTVDRLTDHSLGPTGDQAALLTVLPCPKLRGRMTRWHFNETKELVLAKFGRNQLELVRPCIQSVSVRQWYAAYHYGEVCRLLDSFVTTQLAGASLLEVASDQDAVASDDFNRFLLEAGAHVLACVQCLHATADILAHVVYLALGMNLSAKPMKELDVSLLNVATRLRHEQPDSDVYRLLGDFNSGGHFDHLSALSNISKHRSILRPSLDEDWTGARLERHMLRIPSFSRLQKHYPEVTVKEFLEPEYNRCSKLVVDVGNALNTFLRTNTP